ncbi:hypothetical protein NDU88_006064 [Pleurodeles waltl]|uniref:Uncharacterized protein n=1 Tax=Pleurodeles waltl TaxID=8319 RepID=A0AAV7TEI9_PLEWA|nr:hypothetical protein NDU88_006064 [Pleurodeles waltl]
MLLSLAAANCDCPVRSLTRGDRPEHSDTSPEPLSEAPVAWCVARPWGLADSPGGRWGSGPGLGAAVKLGGERPLAPEAGSAVGSDSTLVRGVGPLGEGPALPAGACGRGLAAEEGACMGRLVAAPCECHVGPRRWADLSLEKAVSGGDVWRLLPIPFGW